MKNVFVIAGGSSDLGKALGALAYRMGYPVALLSRGLDGLEIARKEILKNGEKGKVSVHPVDLSDTQAAFSAFNEIENIHGSIGVLVNCVGTWMARKEATDLHRDDFEESFRLNFYPIVNTTHETLRIRRKSNQSPLSIINVGATGSIRGGIRTSPFCSAKAAVRSYSQSLAKELAKESVHVAHLIIDGLISNERTKKLNPGCNDESFIHCTSIAESILQIVGQKKDCWTFEWDMRPYNEKW